MFLQPVLLILARHPPPPQHYPRATRRQRRIAQRIFVHAGCGTTSRMPRSSAWYVVPDSEHRTR